jgi:adenine/guanine/hypoxanthine permease
LVNPQILARAGIPPDGVVFATCVSAVVATLVMGLYANYPIALAPGMSLNAYFTYSVCIAMHFPWRTALAVVLCSGVLFLVLIVTRVREQIVSSMPDCLKHSTAAGIGMFMAFVGLRNAKLVVADPATYVGLGRLADKEVLWWEYANRVASSKMARFPAWAGSWLQMPWGPFSGL